MAISELIRSIQTASQSLSAPNAIAEADRLELLKAISQLKTTLETPIETTIDLALGDVKLIGTRLAIDLGIFNASAGKSEVDLATLAAEKKADKQLVFRIMRFLTAMGFFEARTAEAWCPKPMAGLYADGSPLRDAIHHYATLSTATVRLPSFFEKNSNTSPSDPHRSPWQHATGDDKLFFEWLNHHPEDLATFNRFIVLARLGIKESWFDFYPVSSRLAGASNTEPLLVDIGGGVGHDLIAFEKAHPSLPGKLILQDLPSVIDQAVASSTLPSRAETMKHDFFEPQPVKNARAYYLRSVMHDWSDEYALKILANVYEAMGPESVLLVNETVMSDGPNISLWEAKLDFTMMTAFGSLERTRRQWVQLLEQAGFEVTVWTPKEKVQGTGELYEAKRK